VRGRHLITGLPTEIQLRSEEVRSAIEGPLREIIDAIKDTLEQTPPELTSDIARDGILLAGGGTLLRGLPSLDDRRKDTVSKVVLVAHGACGGGKHELVWAGAGVGLVRSELIAQMSEERNLPQASGPGRNARGRATTHEASQRGVA
jgi:hypothetical protein